MMGGTADSWRRSNMAPGRQSASGFLVPVFTVAFVYHKVQELNIVRICLSKSPSNFLLRIKYKLRYQMAELNRIVSKIWKNRLSLFLCHEKYYLMTSID